MKYVDIANDDYLIAALKREYEISEDWAGSLYWGITLEWNYYNEQTKRYANIQTPVYINKQLKKHQHEISKTPQHSPYPESPKKYGK